ncbi:deoxyribonuclease-2-alpha-like [Suncus etruscus]|uniref:deoxyribonuclease-2-alpha-like n=1 Tax=Suncus etruscus TaxID=109475 RepID=UPI0021106227|nr:deoxyribonuclease-2-alpha-like [Suncus etruscus]
MAAPSSLLLAILLWVPAETLTCIGDSGKPVDWFVIYKLPKKCDDGSAVPDRSVLPNGLSYKYLDAKSKDWQDGVGTIREPKGALALTLAPLYQNNKSQIAFLLYNDQPPPLTGKTNGQSGHSKGVVLLDLDEGFWLVHSVPKFPPHTSNPAFSWPSNAQCYGQTLFCVTFPSSQFHDIGKQLSYIYPLVYDKDLKIIEDNLPELVAVAKGQRVQREPWKRSVNLISKAGATFQSFAKASNFKDDLYSGWVAEALGSDLQVQFWRRKTMPPSCSGQYHVSDVINIEFPGGPSYRSTKDHSKWAVASTSTKTWVCVSDLNRSYGGYLRGGGALCTQIRNLFNSFKSLVKMVQPCPHPVHPSS